MSDGRARSDTKTASSETAGAPDRRTILVVDDEPLNRLLLRSMLGPAFEVVEADGGEEALRVMDRDAVDLALVDVRMPGMDGFELCRRIRASAGRELIPVVLVSATMTQADREVGFAAGADDYQRKPVDRAELLLRVGSLLRAASQERRLREQLRSLQEVSALKDDLVSMAVHDLRNPLTGMLALLQRMETVPTARTEVEVARLLQTATRMHGALDDMLRIRELEEGRVSLDIAELNLLELARDAVVDLSPAAEARGLTMEVGGVAATVRVDRALLVRAVQNLVGNAIKFSPRNERITLTVSATPFEVALSVCDRGPGVSAVHKETVFEKFVVGQRRHDAGRAFGLGLYLVRLAANAHGGIVEAMDNEGGGACFRIVLPCGVPPPAA